MQRTPWPFFVAQDRRGLSKILNPAVGMSQSRPDQSVFPLLHSPDGRFPANGAKLPVARSHWRQTRRPRCVGVCVTLEQLVFPICALEKILDGLLVRHEYAVLSPASIAILAMVSLPSTESDEIASPANSMALYWRRQLLSFLSCKDQVLAPYQGFRDPLKTNLIVSGT